MKTIITSAVLTVALAAGTVFADEAKCIWEFGRTPIAAEDVTGDLKVSGTSFFLDGQNQLRLPKGVLPDGDYTIEFELRAENRRDISLIIFSMQDCDYEKGPFSMVVDRGWAFGYYAYGAGMLYYNRGKASMEVNVGTCPIPYGQDGKYIKQTFMRKGARISYFRDGLILMCTEDIVNREDKDTVLRFGQLRGTKEAPVTLKTPLEVRNLKIYDAARFPTGFDPTISRRMSVNGAEFNVYMEPRTGKNADKKRILTVGDSIHMHYRGRIAAHFTDLATTDYWFGGCWFGKDAIKPEPGSTLSKPEIAWKGIADRIGQYDVITFNPMTLHWWSARFPTRCDASYLKDNLRHSLTMMRKYQPKAKIIWLPCTPVRSKDKDGNVIVDPEHPDNRRIIPFNKMALEVVKEFGLPVVDLWTEALKHVGECPKDWQDTCHWKEGAANAFANLIVPEIEKVIGKQQEKK